MSGRVVLETGVYAPAEVEIQEVRIYVDGQLLATDTIPYYDDGYQHLYPGHAWDSAMYPDGIYEAQAIAETSLGAISDTIQIDVRHHLPTFFVSRSAQSTTEANAQITEWPAAMGGNTSVAMDNASVFLGDVPMNWSDTKGDYYTDSIDLVPLTEPGSILAFTARHPDMSDVSVLLTMPYPVLNLRIDADESIDQWVSGGQNNLHALWDPPIQEPEQYLCLYRYYRLQITCYDDLMNDLGSIEGEIPIIDNNSTDCYIPRAVLPSNTEYASICMISMAGKLIGQHCPPEYQDSNWIYKYFVRADIASVFISNLLI